MTAISDCNNTTDFRAFSEKMEQPILLQAKTSLSNCIQAFAAAGSSRFAYVVNEKNCPLGTLTKGAVAAAAGPFIASGDQNLLPAASFFLTWKTVQEIMLPFENGISLNGTKEALSRIIRKFGNAAVIGEKGEIIGEIRSSTFFHPEEELVRLTAE